MGEEKRFEVKEKCADLEVIYKDCLNDKELDILLEVFYKDCLCSNGI
jgi:hypothetical protein